MIQTLDRTYEPRHFIVADSDHSSLPKLQGKVHLMGRRPIITKIKRSREVYCWIALDTQVLSVNRSDNHGCQLCGLRRAP